MKNLVLSASGAKQKLKNLEVRAEVGRSAVLVFRS